jgi:hypothetical protein
MQLSKRMALVCAVALLAFASMGMTDDASAANLLLNPGFETGDLTDWLVFGQSPNSDVTVLAGDNGPSAPGTHNAFMDNQAEALGLTLKQSTVPGSAMPGDVDYSYDLKLDQADVGGVFFVQIFAEQSGVGIIGGTGLMGPLWPWGTWTTYSGSFVAPAGTDFLTIQFMANTGAATGSNCLMHVDNVVLDQGTVPVESATWSSVKAMFR